MATIKMPSSEEIDKAYKDAITRVPGRYKDAVSKVTDFKEKAIAGQDNYEEQMAKASVLARRKEKLEAMEANEWREKAQTLGAARIGSGMTANAPKRKKNYEGIRAALDGLTIEDRTPNWEENIEGRLKPVVRAQKEAAGKL